MASYIEIFDLKNPLTPATPLKKKVTVAIVTAAEYILEHAPEFDTANATQEDITQQEKRVMWANRSLVSPEMEADRMLWAVLRNATVQTQGNNTPDSDIQWVIENRMHIFF